MPSFSIATRARRQMVNVSANVRSLIEKSGVKEGIALVTVLHTTCGLLVNDANSGWEEDMLAFLGRLVPDLDFHHLHDGPEHAKSHILGALIGPTVQIAVEGGRPVLGTWQSIFLVEVEGPRERTVNVTVCGR
jgi:secondary thiamine-phosphate synthase enzyme